MTGDEFVDDVRTGLLPVAAVVTIIVVVGDKVVVTVADTV